MLTKTQFEELITRMAIAGSVNACSRSSQSDSFTETVEFTVSAGTGLEYIEEFSDFAMPVALSLTDGFALVTYNIVVEHFSVDIKGETPDGNGTEYETDNFKHHGEPVCKEGEGEQ